MRFILKHSQYHTNIKPDTNHSRTEYHLASPSTAAASQPQNSPSWASVSACARLRLPSSQRIQPFPSRPVRRSDRRCRRYSLTAKSRYVCNSDLAWRQSRHGYCRPFFDQRVAPVQALGCPCAVQDPDLGRHMRELDVTEKSEVEEYVDVVISHVLIL